MTTHEWKVAVHERQFFNVVDKWQEFASRGHRLLGDIELHTSRFTADERFVQLSCTRCGAYAVADNVLPIRGPYDHAYWAEHPCA